MLEPLSDLAAPSISSDFDGAEATVLIEEYVLLSELLWTRRQMTLLLTEQSIAFIAYIRINK